MQRWSIHIIQLLLSLISTTLRFWTQHCNLLSSWTWGIENAASFYCSHFAYTSITIRYIHTTVITHHVTVEGIVSSREVASTHANWDSSQVQAQPPPAGQLRLTVEHVVACWAEHAHLESGRGKRHYCQASLERIERYAALGSYDKLPPRVILSLQLIQKQNLHNLSSLYLYFYST